MDPVFFLHIPKTAGTSLRLWLKQAMPEVGSEDLFFVEDIARTPDESLCARSLLAAHAGVDVLDRLARLRPAVRSLTVLREPAAHTSSAWAYYRGLSQRVLTELDQSDPWLAALVRSIKAAEGFQIFATSPEWPNRFAGFQTRYIATGIASEASALPMAPPDLIKARTRLTGLTAFGLVEHPVRTAALFCQALGWPWLGPFGDHNPGPVDRPAPSEASAADMEMDAGLYTFASALFEHRWADLCARMGADPAAPDGGLAVVADGLDREALAAMAPVRSGWTGVEDGLFARGLGERFFYEPEGRWLRNLTGEMTLFVPCPAGARRLSLCFGYLLPDPEKVSLRLNRKATPFDIRYELEPGGAWRFWLETEAPVDKVNAVAATVSGVTDVNVQGSFLGFAVA